MKLPPEFWIAATAFVGFVLYLTWGICAIWEDYHKEIHDDWEDYKRRKSR